MNTQKKVTDDPSIAIRPLTAEEVINNSPSQEEVKPDSELKKWLVGYVGDKTKPEKNEVTVEDIVETMAKEFPEFLLVVAEENWIRGYHQALSDMEEGQKIYEAENQKNIDPDPEDETKQDENG